MIGSWLCKSNQVEWCGSAIHLKQCVMKEIERLTE